VQRYHIVRKSKSYLYINLLSCVFPSLFPRFMLDDHSTRKGVLIGLGVKLYQRIYGTGAVASWRPLPLVSIASQHILFFVST